MSQGELGKKIFEQYSGKNVEVILRADIPGFSGKVAGKVTQCNENFIVVGDALLAYPMIWGIKPVAEDTKESEKPQSAPVSVPAPAPEKPEIEEIEIESKNISELSDDLKGKIFEGELILFHPRRKYGAIFCSELDDYNIPSVKNGEIFVHANQISDENLKQKLLNEDKKKNNHKPMIKVTFKISQNEKGACADDVRAKIEIVEPKLEPKIEPETKIEQIQIPEPEIKGVKEEVKVEEKPKIEESEFDFGVSLGSILGNWDKEEEKFSRPKTKSKPKLKNESKSKYEPEIKSKSKEKTKTTPKPKLETEPKLDLDLPSLPDSEPITSLEKVPEKKLDWRQQRFEGDLIFYHCYREFGFIFCPQLEKYGVVQLEEHEEDHDSRKQQIIFHIGRVSDKLLKTKLISEKIFEPMIKVFFRIRKGRDGGFWADDIQAKYKKTDNLLKVRRPDFSFETAEIESIKHSNGKIYGKIKVGTKLCPFSDRSIIDPVLLVALEQLTSVKGLKVRFTKIQRPSGNIEVNNLEIAEDAIPDDKIQSWERLGMLQRAKERLELEI